MSAGLSTWMSPGAINSAYLKLNCYSPPHPQHLNEVLLPTLEFLSWHHCPQFRRPRLKCWVKKNPQRRKWQLTPACLPGEFCGQRSLMCYSAWGHKVSDTTEWLTPTSLSWSSRSQNWSLAFLCSLSEPLSPLHQLPSSGIIWLLPCLHWWQPSSAIHCACVLSRFSHIWLFGTPWTVACKAPLSMGFSRQEYWSGLSCPPSGDLPNKGIKPRSFMSPALAFTTSATWEALLLVSPVIWMLTKVFAIDWLIPWLCEIKAGMSWPSEKAMALHSSTFAWKIPWTEEPGGLQSMGLLESDRTEWLHFHFSLSYIGEGNGNPLQCSCLENPRDWRAWWAAVYGVTQSQTRLKRLSSSSSSSSSPDPSFSASRVTWAGKGFPRSVLLNATSPLTGCLPFQCYSELCFTV